MILDSGLRGFGSVWSQYCSSILSNDLYDIICILDE